MQPYYSDDSVTLYHGTWQEVLPTIPHADLVLTSPPYNKGDQSGDYANMADGYDGDADDLPEAEYVAQQQDLLSECWRLTADNGAIFYNHKPQLRDGAVALPTRLIPDGVVLRQVIVWDRSVGMNWNASHFCPQHEWVLLLAHPRFRLTSRSASAAGDVWRVGIERDRSIDHPCPFPLSLANTAIGATDARLVVDPHAGSGTTLRAAKDLGRKAIGIERSERYCEIAADRMGQEVLDLGAAS